MPSGCRTCASALVEADSDEHLNLLERGDAHFAINVINTMQVDGNRFASYALPPFQMVAVSRRDRSKTGPAKRSTSASSASFRCCC